MITLLCANHRIPNFHFRTAALKPYSTIRHMGIIDLQNIIRDHDVTYRDIQSYEGQIRLPRVGSEETDTPV